MLADGRWKAVDCGDVVDSKKAALKQLLERDNPSRFGLLMAPCEPIANDRF